MLLAYETTVSILELLELSGLGAGAAAVFLRFDLEHHLGRVVIGFLIDQDGFDHRLSRHQLDVGAAGLGFRVGRDVKGQGFGPNLPPPSSLPA